MRSRKLTVSIAAVTAGLVVTVCGAGVAQAAEPSAAAPGQVVPAVPAVPAVPDPGLLGGVVTALQELLPSIFGTPPPPVVPVVPVAPAVPVVPVPAAPVPVPAAPTVAGQEGTDQGPVPPAASAGGGVSAGGVSAGAGGGGSAGGSGSASTGGGAGGASA